MKLKKYLTLILIFLLTIIFSCKNDPPKPETPEKNKCTVVFNIFDKDKGYIESERVEVENDTPLADIQEKISTVETVPEYKFKKYTFADYWTIEPPTEGEVKTSGEKFELERHITENLSLYAVYLQKDIYCQLTFMEWDDTDGLYKQNSTSIDALCGDKLESYLIEPTNIVFERGEKKYTFLGWSETLATNTILETGSTVDGDSIITSSKTLYAKYTSDEILHTVKLFTYNPLNQQYEPMQGEDIKVKNDTKLNEISLSEIEDVTLNTITHHFIGWTQTLSSDRDIMIDKQVVSNETSIQKDETFYAVYDTYDSYIQRVTVNDKDDLSRLSSDERNEILLKTLDDNSYTNFSINNALMMQISTPSEIEYKDEKYKTTIAVNESGTKYSILENNSAKSSNTLPSYIIDSISSLIKENNYNEYVYDTNRDVFVCVYNMDNPQTGDGRFLYKKIYVKNGIAYKVVVAFNPEFLNDVDSSEYILEFQKKYNEAPIGNKEFVILNLDTSIDSAVINNSNLEYIDENGKNDVKINISKTNNNIVVDTGSDSGDLYLVISNTSMSEATAPSIKGYENDVSSTTLKTNRLNSNNTINTNKLTNTFQNNNKNKFYDRVIEVEKNITKKRESKTLNKNLKFNSTSLTSKRKSKYADLQVGDSITLGNDGQPDTPGLWVIGVDSNGYEVSKKKAVTLKVKRTVSTKLGDKTLLIFVEDDMWGEKGAGISQSFVESQADAFLKEGFDNDIYDWMTSVFNSEWSDFSSSLDANTVQTFNRFYGSDSSQGVFIDNYDEIVILYADILDQGESSADGGVVGYFYCINNWVNEYVTDQYYDEYSNEAVMLTLNAYFCNKHPENSMSTLAHEFQHAIHYHHREAKKGFSGVASGLSFHNDSSTWINEMCSALAEEILAKKIGIQGPSNNDKDKGHSGLNYLDYYQGRVPQYISGSKYDITDWYKVSSVNSLYPYGLVYSLGGYLLRNINTDFIKNIYSSDLYEYDSKENARDFLLNVINSSNNSNYTWSDILRMWGASVLMSDNNDPPKKYAYSIMNSSTDFWFKNLFKTELYIPSIDFFIYENDYSDPREMWQGGPVLCSEGPYIYNTTYPYIEGYRKIERFDRPYTNFVGNSINPNTNTFVLLGKNVSGKKVYNIDVSSFDTSALKFTFVKK